MSCLVGSLRVSTTPNKQLSVYFYFFAHFLSAMIKCRDRRYGLSCNFLSPFSLLCRNSGAPLWGSPITERNVTSSASLYCRFQACPFISGRHSHRQQSDLVVFTPDCFSWGNPSLGLDKVESNLEPSGGRLWFCCASCLSGSFLKQLLRI